MSNDKVALRPRRLGHANIFVSELERSMAFYQQVCGLTDVFREPGIQMGFLSNGNSHHDVGLMQVMNKPRIGRDGHVQIPQGRGTRPGLNHLGFEMENEAELVAAYQRAQKAGTALNRVVDHGMSHSIYLFDPEGTLLEFYADVIEDWRGFYASNENQLITGDWRPDAAKAERRPLYVAEFEPSRVAGAALSPRRTAQAVLAVEDLAAMAAFYTDVAGLTPVAGSVAEGILVLAGGAGEPSLTLAACRPGEAPGLRKVGFELTAGSDLGAARAALAKSGVQPVAASATSVTVADPDGLQLEFYVGARDGAATRAAA